MVIMTPVAFFIKSRLTDRPLDSVPSQQCQFLRPAKVYVVCICDLTRFVWYMIYFWTSAVNKINLDALIFPSEEMEATKKSIQGSGTTR